MRWWLLVLVVCLVTACTPKDVPPPPVPPPPEDLSTWTVPAVIQPVPPEPQVTRTLRLPAGPAEKVYDYTPGVAVDVPVAVGAPLDILLEPGEQVHQIVDGDRSPVEQGQERRWTVKEGSEGSGEHQRPHLFVTVTEPGLVNGLIVTTSKRAYLITCKSVGKSPTRVLRWYYPADPDHTPAKVKEPGLLPDPTEPKRWHVGYTLESSHQQPPTWMPRVYDDGQKIYLVMREVTLFETAPMVRMVSVNGPALINARQYLNVLIVDQLAPRLELRVGMSETAEVVTITRGTAMRTITCPGSGDCPVWPAAAQVLARQGAQP